MITAQDIRDKSFEKAVFGGYDMGMVDEFMEEIANDLTLLQKENAVLKGKMKVLVDKVDEYRGNEEALRNAVFSAQKLGSSIEADAKEKASAMLTEAKSQADSIIGSARAEATRITEGVSAELSAEETKLEETRKISAEFIDRMDQLCRRQLEFLQRVGEMDFMRQHRAEQSQQTAARPAAPVQPQRPAPQAEEAPKPTPAARPATVPVESVKTYPSQEETPEIHETIKSIEETVAKVIEEPVINVRPGMGPAVVEDERPTRSFNIISDPEDDVEKSNILSLDDLSGSKK